MYSSAYLRSINYRILFFIATFAIPSCCFSYRVMSFYRLVTHHITRQVEKKKCEEHNKTKLMQSMLKRANFSMKNYGWWKVLDVSKSDFLFLLWTIGPKHQNKILNMHATSVWVCANRIESNFYLICLMSWNYDIDDRIKNTHTHKKNEQFPRNL